MKEFPIKKLNELRVNNMSRVFTPSELKQLLKEAHMPCETYDILITTPSVQGIGHTHTRRYVFTNKPAYIGWFESRLNKKRARYREYMKNYDRKQREQAKKWRQFTSSLSDEQREMLKNWAELSNKILAVL